MIYLDYAASAPPFAEACQILADTSAQVFGNPSSLHAYGAQARTLLRRSRETLAQLLHAAPQDLIFTSGGTEANNTAMAAVAATAGERRKIVVAATEHHSVLYPAEQLKHSGFTVVTVAPDDQGRISPESVARVLDRSTALLCVHAVNNETGAVQDIAALAQEAHRVGALYLCDAVQSFGHLDLPLHCADFVSLSGHKFGAPRGAGVLMVKESAPFAPLLRGGGQELGRRAGTENLPGIAALARAAELACTMQETESLRLTRLSQLLAALLQKSIPDLVIHSGDAHRYGGILSLGFPGALGEDLQIRLNEAGIAVGVGAACAAGENAPSHVLTAMGLTPREARETLRISMGRLTTEEDIRTTAQVLTEIYRKIRI